MANNIALDLQRVARIEAVMRGFKRRICPILAFAFAAKNVPLEGTDEMVVPFYDLDGAASRDFDATTGYVFDQDSDTASRKVKINKRKYKALSVTSSELARQPMLDPVKLLEIKGEKLAEDAVNDCFSLITLANFGAAVLDGAISAFDSNDIADIRTACKKSQWPEAGRALLLNADLDGQLFKDNSIKSALNFGSASAIQDGVIPKVNGFDYYDVSSLPTNGEHLVGLAAFMSAIIIGSAPIAPAPSVRAVMSAYELIPVEVAPGVTIMLEYRAFGDATKDASHEIIEFNYGYAKGNAAAIKRITDPAA